MPVLVLWDYLEIEIYNGKCDQVTCNEFNKDYRNALDKLEIVEALDMLGQGGWEMISVLATSSNADTDRYYFFKRPRSV